MNTDFHSGRILVVDDETSSLELLGEILTSVGNKVETAADGREALAKVNSFVPEVILLDLQMPGRDGLELGKLIRVNPRFSMTSIVMISGLSDPDLRRRAVQCGADDFMTKPLKSEELILRVASAVRLWRMRQEISELKRENDLLQASAASAEGLAASRGTAGDLQAVLETATADLRRSVMKWAGVEANQERGEENSHSAGSAEQVRLPNAGRQTGSLPEEMAVGLRS